MQSRGIYHFTHFSFHTEIAVNQCKNPTTLFFPCRKPIVGAGAYAALSHQVPSSVIPNRGLLTARQGGSEPTKPGRVPKIPFHCAFFLWKSLESLAEISPHSLGRAFHSPGGLSTKVAFQAVRCLTWALLVSREAEGGKAKVCPALVLEFSVFEAVPLTESLQPLKPPARSQWETFCMPGWATK